MNNTFRSGMIFTAIGSYSILLIQFLINVILSRILSVEEFGIVANAQVYLLFFQLIVTAGIGPAIIQKKDLSEEDYGILFNYTILFSLLLSVVFGLLGRFVAFSYQNDDYKNLFWAMSIVVFFEGINTVPKSILNKTLRFKDLNLRVCISSAFGAIFGVYAAFSGWGIYALVICSAVPSVIAFILNISVVKLKYTLSWNPKPLISIYSFSRNQFFFTFFNYLSRNADNLLVGRFLGPTSIANYQKSYQLLSMPTTVFLGVITPVLQPILSQHQDNVKIIQETFFKIIRVLSLLAFSLTVFMMLNAKEIIFFLFGSKWYGAVTPFFILSFSLWSQMLVAVTSGIFMARNQSKMLFINGIISFCIMIPSIIIGVGFGKIIYVAVFVCIANLINFLISYWLLMNKALNGRLRDALKQLIKPAFIGAIVAIILFFTNPFLSFPNLFITLLFRGIFWLLAVTICMYVSGEMKVIKKLLSE
ncbi:lipopolysaccharide biosynthesis protein [Enterococcus sp. LJL99]